MPKLKVLSGEEVIKVFIALDFIIEAQRGSHVKISRHSANIKQTLTIPRHPELDKGTLKAIYRQALKYISDDELRPYFYSE